VETAVMKNIVAFSIASLLASVSSADICKSNQSSRIEEEICRLSNIERAKDREIVLVLDPKLSRVARAHAKDMIIRKFFSHDSPDGETMSMRLKKSGAIYGYAGENIARGYKGANEVVSGWMNSRGHRKNILHPKYKKIGVGVVDRHYVQVFTD
jgi:uncharacterized protein YkwD